MSDDNKLTPVNNGIERVDEEEKVIDIKEQTPEAPTTKVETKKKSSNMLGLVAGVAALALVGVIGYNGYNYLSTGSTSSSVPAVEVMQEKYSPELKAKKLDPTRIYDLEGTKDSYGGMTLTVTRVQFRQDATRLWIKVDNDSGKKINTMMSMNSSLVDEDGNTYKPDSFSSDNIVSVAPNSHEEIMLVFDPVKADASHITFNLDNVSDMKQAAWNYSIGFDLP